MPSALLEAWEAHGGFALSSSLQAALQSWCRRLEALGSALLPLQAGGCAYYVSLARSASEWRVLHYVIRQAFTPDVLDCVGESDEARLPAQLHAAMMQAGVGLWRLHKIHDPQACRGSYRALNTVEDRRSALAGAVSISTGQLMRSFRRAVEQGDSVEAQELLEDLRSHRLVYQHNVSFLDAWRIARLRPRALASSEQLGIALGERERMPLDLRGVLGASVLEHTVAPWLAEKGPESLRASLRAAVPLVPARLIQQCQVLMTSVGACCRILGHLRDVSVQVIDADWEQSTTEYRWIDSLRELVRESPGVEPLVEEATGREEPAGRPPAVEGEVEPVTNSLGGFVAKIEARSFEEADVYRLSALISDGHRDAQDLLDQWWSRLDKEGREQWQDATKHTREKWVQEQEQPPECSDWLTWMESGVDEGDFSFSEWQLVPDVTSTADWSRFATAVVGMHDPVFVGNLGTLLKAWEQCLRASVTPPRDVVESFANKVLVTILLDENALSSGNNAGLLYDLFRISLESGITTEPYAELVDQLRNGVVERISSHRLLEELVDVLELLVDSKQPDVKAIEDLLRAFQMAAQKNCTRMGGSPALDILCTLLEFRGLHDEAEALRSAIPPHGGAREAEEGLRVCPVRGKRILIYTLEESSGERAKKAIEHLYGAEVRTDASHQASATLKSGLEWADIVICVTRAAQHAATNEVDRVTDDDVLIRPAGKGTSSILRDLARWRDDRLLRTAG